MAHNIFHSQQTSGTCAGMYACNCTHQMDKTVWHQNRKRKEQKRTLTMTIREAHSLFMDKHPNITIGKSKKSRGSSYILKNAPQCKWMYHHKNIVLYQELYHVMLIFIIVIFSIVEKVNRVKIQYLTLLYVNICWWLLCWYFIWWMLIIWAAVEYIKKGSFASRITTHHLVRISLYYCWSVFFCV